MPSSVCAVCCYCRSRLQPSTEGCLWPRTTGSSIGMSSSPFSSSGVFGLPGGLPLFFGSAAGGASAAAAATGLTLCCLAGAAVGTDRARHLPGLIRASSCIHLDCWSPCRHPCRNIIDPFVTVACLMSWFVLAPDSATTTLLAYIVQHQCAVSRMRGRTTVLPSVGARVHSVPHLFRLILDVPRGQRCDHPR